MNTKANRLIELAKHEFGTLTRSELKLFSNVTMSNSVDFSSGDVCDRDVTTSNKWNEDRVIKASRIAWLCRNSEAASLVGRQGVAIIGARILERIDLSSLKISFPIILVSCSIPEGFYLRHAEMLDILITKSFTGPILAGAVKMAGSLILQNSVVNGNINLIKAKIKGNLDLNGSHLVNNNNQTITADHLTVEGNIFLNNGFKSEGVVQLNGVKIGGDLQCCDNSQFMDAGPLAVLLAQSVEIGGNVIMNDGFRADGMVDFRGAIIKKRIECISAHFEKKKTEFAFIADAANIGGGIICDNAVVIGGFRLNETKINIVMQCDGARFFNENGQSLCIQGAEIRGNLFLRQIESHGEVNLTMVKVEGNLECDQSSFVNVGAKAFNAEGLAIRRNLYLRNDFRAEGEVNLLNAKIGNDFSCTRGHFLNKGGNALMAERIEVVGNAFLRQIEAAGLVSIASGKISGHFAWTDVVTPKEITLDLRYSRIGVLWDDTQSWPSKDSLWLNGFVFEQFDSRSTKDIESRIEWISLQPSNRFYSQPYEQLALVYMKEGREEDAKRVLIEKNEDASLISQKSFSDRLWHHFLGWTIAYGYRPFRVLGWVFGFFVLGWIIFGFGNRCGFMIPSKADAYLSPNIQKEEKILSPDYSKFSAVIYSIDAFIPFLNLHVSDYWLPSANKGGKHFLYFTLGELLRIYLIIHTFAGWILTTIFLVGLTGLIKR